MQVHNPIKKRTQVTSDLQCDDEGDGYQVVVEDDERQNGEKEGTSCTPRVYETIAIFKHNNIEGITYVNTFTILQHTHTLPTVLV